MWSIYMQKEREQLLLIISYDGFYQEDYKIPIPFLLHGVEVLPHAQPSYVTSLCKSAGHLLQRGSVTNQCSCCILYLDFHKPTKARFHFLLLFER